MKPITWALVAAGAALAAYWHGKNVAERQKMLALALLARGVGAAPSVPQLAPVVSPTVKAPPPQPTIVFPKAGPPPSPDYIAAGGQELLGWLP